MNIYTYVIILNMRKITLLFTLWFFLLCGCTSAPIKSTQVALDVGFKDIAVTFVGYTNNEADYQKYYDLLVTRYTQLGHLYDKYKNYDGLINLKTLNDTAGLGPQVVDQELINLLLSAQTWTEKSKSTFNITLGAVLNIWHTYREEGKLFNQETPSSLGNTPSLDALTQANACTGWENIVIDDAKNSIEILNPCTQLDVGGIGKGYATDLVAKDLKAAGLTTAILNIGDSSILTIGSKPDGTEWGIGISQPSRPLLIGSNSVDTLYFPGDIAVSTSGDNQNYYTAQDGNIYHHLIDPSTLFPVQSSLHAVTVTTTLSAGDAEALSKALFILPYEEASFYLSDLQTSFPNEFIGALWVFEMGQAPQGSTFIDSEGYRLVHSENLKDKSRLYRAQ